MSQDIFKEDSSYKSYMGRVSTAIINRTDLTSVEGCEAQRLFASKNPDYDIEVIPVVDPGDAPMADNRWKEDEYRCVMRDYVDSDGVLKKPISVIKFCYACASDININRST